MKISSSEFFEQLLSKFKQSGDKVWIQGLFIMNKIAHVLLPIIYSVEY